MGEHKRNPIAAAAKLGLLQPKPRKISRREEERRLYAKIMEILFQPYMVARDKTEEDYGKTD